MDRTSLDWLIYLKRAVNCDKTSRCYDAIFDSVALVSWMRLWLQLFIHNRCIQADVLICWINKTFQVLSPVSNCCQYQTVTVECSHDVHFFWLYHCPVFFSLFFFFINYLFIVIIFLFFSFLVFYLLLFFLSFLFFINYLLSFLFRSFLVIIFLYLLVIGFLSFFVVVVIFFL